MPSNKGHPLINLQTVGEYRRAIKALREFADGFEAKDGFDLRYLKSDIYHPDKNDPMHYYNPLSPAKREKIARYFDVLQRHHGYKGTLYQTFKDKRTLKSAQRAMGMPTWVGWRGVFVPQPAENTPATLIRVEKKWVIQYRKQGVDTVFVPFNKIQFAERGVDYVRDLFKNADPSYKYNLDMGHGRNRWKAGGNLDQMLRDLGFLIEHNIAGTSGQTEYENYIMGVHVYRATWDTFNTLKRAQQKTMAQKRVDQEEIKKKIASERRKLKSFEIQKAADRVSVRRGTMTRRAYQKWYGEPY